MGTQLGIIVSIDRAKIIRSASNMRIEGIKNTQIQVIRQRITRIKSSETFNIYVHYHKNYKINSTNIRIVVIIPKKVIPLAVHRNKIRRIIKNCHRQILHLLNRKYIYIIKVKNSNIINYKYAHIQECIHNTFKSN